MSNTVKEDVTIRVLSIGADRDRLLSIKQIIEGGGHKVKIAGAAKTQDAENAINKYVWDFIYVSDASTDPAILKNFARLASQRSSSSLLVIADDIDDQSALLVQSAYIRDVVSITRPRHFLFVFERELHDLEERRHHVIVKNQFLLSQKEQQHQNGQIDNTGDYELFAASEVNTRKFMPKTCAKYDLATNLYSQQYFMTELSSVLTEIQSYKKKYAVLYFEFAGMAVIRSELGINASDNLLNEIAAIMRDNIGQLGPIARFSYQVIAVLVAFSNIDEVLKVINSTRAMVADHIRLSFSQRASCSQINVGMCMVNKMSDSSYQLIAKAERACDIATSINQSGIHIYNPEIDDIGSRNRTRSLRNWEKHIRLALLDDRFKVVYQMISRLDDTGGNDYELLFRMIDRDSGEDIMPGEFIVTAEQTSLIVVIDQWVTSQAIKMIADDEQQGRAGRYFVKLSSRTLLSESFIPWLQDELNKQGIDASRLVFEINTNELVKRPIEVQAFTRALNTLNCLIVLEYFGTQKNHMVIMEQFTVNFIKLDRSLTHDVANDESRISPVRTIVAEAEAANVEAMAEFVEDAKTLSVLCNVGIKFIQGHFVQHPGGMLDASNG